MKNIRSAIQCVVVCCLFSLTSCGSIQTKQYQSPKNISGKSCVRECNRLRSSCGTMSCTRNNSCDSSERLEIDLQNLRDSGGRLYANDPFTGSSNSTDCTERYEECFENCGGTVGYRSMGKKPVEVLLYGTAAVAIMLINNEKNK